MNSTVSDVLNFMSESEVKFIRLGFSDIFGAQKNISIMAHEFEAACEYGVSIDAHAISGFKDVTHSDLFLVPDPLTLTILPWRPGPGRVVRFFCDIKNPDGTLFEHDTRLVLKRVLEECSSFGLETKVGAECEFYLFKTDEDGEPTTETVDRGSYLDIAPLDRGEDIRREICLTLEEMGIMPEASHHEQGPGQNEVDFKFSDALTCADNLMTFKSVVKAIASRNGLYASFMPKPIPGEPGNGMHVNLSLTQKGKNHFEGVGQGASTVADSFIAGVLEHTPEISLFLNPLDNSYERLGEFDAPRYVSWSHQNRSQLVRIPAASSEKARMELRSPDPAANPYLAFALILAAGLDGIKQNMVLPPSVDADLNTADQSITAALVKLPDSLLEAIRLARQSELVKTVIGEGLFARFITLKEQEAADYVRYANKELFYRERNFDMI